MHPKTLGTRVLNFSLLRRQDPCLLSSMRSRGPRKYLSSQQGPFVVAVMATSVAVLPRNLRHGFTSRRHHGGSVGSDRRGRQPRRKGTKIAVVIISIQRCRGRTRIFFIQGQGWRNRVRVVVDDHHYRIDSVFFRIAVTAVVVVIATLRNCNHVLDNDSNRSDLILHQPQVCILGVMWMSRLGAVLKE